MSNIKMYYDTRKHAGGCNAGPGDGLFMSEEVLVIQIGMMEIRLCKEHENEFTESLLKMRGESG